MTSKIELEKEFTKLKAELEEMEKIVERLKELINVATGLRSIS